MAVGDVEDRLHEQAAFDGLDALITQMDADCAKAREILTAL